MSKRKTYTDEFKTMIAELVLSGKTPKEVASEHSISETAVRSWAKKKAPINVISYSADPCFKGILQMTYDYQSDQKVKIRKDG